MANAAVAAPRPISRPLVGVGWLTFGLLAFALHDAALKSLSGDYALGQVMFSRAVVAFPIMLAMVWWESGLASLADRRMGVLLFRSAMLMTGYVCYYMAFAAMTFADAVALYCTVPLIVVVLAGPLLGERVGVVRWIAVAVGFAGVLVMLRPGSGLFEPAGLLILVCALLYSLGMVMARGMAGSVSTSVMSFTNNLIYLLVAPLLGFVFTLPADPATTHASLAFLTRPWTWPPLGDLLVMASCGVTGALGIIGLTAGYRNAEANLVASFEYTYLVWAAVFGFFLFGEVPASATVAGSVMIVVAGLVALRAGQGPDDARGTR
jgi:drug/metabolite transporter (DMT)-like permease